MPTDLQRIATGLGQVRVIVFTVTSQLSATGLGQGGISAPESSAYGVGLLGVGTTMQRTATGLGQGGVNCPTSAVDRTAAVGA